MRRLLLFFFSHRTLAVMRWDLHFLGVRLWNAVTGANAGVRRRVRRMSAPRYLNLGSGHRAIEEPHWINADGFAFSATHYRLDLARPLAFATESFHGILFQHVLEHFPRDGGIRILRECHRILVSDGVLRIAVPDAGLIVRTYVSDPAELLLHRTAPTNTPMETINMYAYQRYEHQCLYDFALLRRTLEEAGFTDITQRSLHNGAVPALARMDDPVYAWESLYVEAVKRGPPSGFRR
jgi:predicted SAM-dependent methyltransferase